MRLPPPPTSYDGPMTRSRTRAVRGLSADCLLTRLPTEILAEICSIVGFCNLKDLANLRLTCLRMAEIGALRLLQLLVVMLDPGYLERMEKMIRNMPIAKDIKELVYCGTVPNSGRYPWCTRQGRRREENVQENNRPFWGSHAEWPAPGSGLDFYVFDTAFASLASLHSVTIICNCSSITGTQARRGTLSLRSSIGFSSLEGSLVYDSYLLGRGEGDGIHQLEALFRAIVAQSKRLKGLAIHGLEFDAFTEWPSPNVGGAGFLTIVDFVGHLTKFVLVGVFTRSTRTHVGKQALKPDGLSVLLRRMIHLRELTVHLRMPRMPEPLRYMYLPDLIGPDQTWMFLETVDFKSLECPGDELLSFIARHGAQRLLKLSLANFFLCSTSWTVFLPQLKAQLPATSIHTVRFSGSLLGNPQRAGYNTGGPKELWTFDASGRFVRTGGGQFRRRAAIISQYLYDPSITKFPFP